MPSFCQPMLRNSPTAGSAGSSALLSGHWPGPGERGVVQPAAEPAGGGDRPAPLPRSCQRRPLPFAYPEAPETPGFGTRCTLRRRRLTEGGGELAHRAVHELAEVGLVGFEPLFVGRDRHAEGDVADGPRRQRVRVLPHALAGELVDDLPPGCV